MSALAGFWSLLLGTLASLSLYLLYKGGVVAFQLRPGGELLGCRPRVRHGAWWSPRWSPRSPRPSGTRSCAGLVYGMGGIDLKGDVLAGDAVWYRSPVLLGADRGRAGRPLLHPGLLRSTRGRQTWSNDSQPAQDPLIDETRGGAAAVRRGPAVRHPPGDRWPLRRVRGHRDADRHLRHRAEIDKAAGRPDQPVGRAGDARLRAAHAALAVAASRRMPPAPTSSARPDGLTAA